MTPKLKVFMGILFWLGLSNQAVMAEWHGPAFSLATPTLAEKGWSSDIVAMSLNTDEGTAYMFREMIGYGINEDLQINLNFPLSEPINRLKDPPRSRIGMMMGGYTDVETSLMWRFHRQAPDIGTRYESTLLAGAGFPTDSRRGGVELSPYFNVAAVTGYASRVHYWWIGAGIERRFEKNDDRLGDLPYATFAYGYRPPFFQRDYPKPDWRVFLEGVAEFPQKDQINGATDPNSGGEKLMIGPSLLGLYGAWGVSGGVLFPAYQNLNGNQSEKNFRAKLVITYWF